MTMNKCRSDQHRSSAKTPPSLFASPSVSKSTLAQQITHCKSASESLPLMHNYNMYMCRGIARDFNLEGYNIITFDMLQFTSSPRATSYNIINGQIIAFKYCLRIILHLETNIFLCINFMSGRPT